MLGFSPLSSSPLGTPAPGSPIGTGVGKISGPLLAPNLERSGTDFSVDTDLLYLNVNDQRVGFGTDVPDATLSVDNFVATSLIIDDVGNIGDLQYVGSGLNEIKSFFGNINILPSGADPVIFATAFGSENVVFDENIIRSEDSNSSIEFYVDPSRKVNVNSNMFVDGGLHATGNVTFDGSITLGNTNVDSIAFNADVNTSIIPDSNLTYQLGSASKKWGETFFYLWNGNVLNASVLVSGGVGFGTRQQNIWYVAKNGLDTNVGDHPNGPFLTVGEAINHAVAGDTIFIYPGTYEEAVPLTVPVGVTVKGADLRNVIIKPDSNTAEDIFLLNGECTIEDITIMDFHFDALNNRGYAFRFAPNMTVTTRSPYVRNVSVITFGTVTSVNDPRGFDTGDAGRGAYLDGSVVNPASKEASLLFHSITFITPGIPCILATNGVRIEWLNSFIYFASIGLQAVSGATGFANNGKTRLRVNGMSAATVTAGDTITLRDNGSTIISATIASIVYDMPTAYIEINGKVEGWETSSPPPDSTVQQDIEFSGGQTAVHIVTADFSDFGAEIRSIGSANVYGNVGALANGVGTLMYLISHNFGYIGTGKLSNNDPRDAIQANEIVTINDGRIYYQSQDHEGDLRVGEIMTVESSTGNIFLNFTFAEFTAGSSLIFSSGGTTTIIDATQVQTGVLRFINSGINNIETGGTVSQRSINLTPGINRGIEISHYTAVELPKGNDVNLTMSTLGEIRFNTAYNDIEGFSSQGKNNLYSIWDKDRTTYILPETSPGANNNVLQFYANNTLQSWINSTGLYSNRLTVSQLTIDGNTIVSNESNSDIELIANAFGVVDISNFQIYDNKIEIDTVNTNLNFITNNGNGYLKFGGGGTRIPTGNSVNRPLVVETAMIRFNETTPELEVYTGDPLLGTNGWIPSAGVTGITVTTEIMEEFTTIWGMTLG
jgi:hypothetical protein